MKLIKKYVIPGSYRHWPRDIVSNGYPMSRGAISTHCMKSMAIFSSAAFARGDALSESRGGCMMSFAFMRFGG